MKDKITALPATARSARTITLSPSGRAGLPNGASTDVARVLRAHGYSFDALALLNALRTVIGGGR